VPAAAVIPAPIAYIKVVAVKKLVVEGVVRPGACFGARRGAPSSSGSAGRPAWTGVVYCEEIRVFKAGVGLYVAAWNNEIGPRAISLVAVQGND
jgi:hypothetical protein